VVEERKVSYEKRKLQNSIEKLRAQISLGSPFVRAGSLGKWGVIA